MKKLAIGIVGILSACTSIDISDSGNDTLLEIGDESVSVEEFNYAFNKNRPADSVASREEIDEYLELYTNFKLKVLEAKSRGMDTTREFRKEFNSYKDQLDESYLQSNDDIDALVDEAYQRLQFEVNAAPILFRLEASAMPEDTLKTYNRALQVRDSIQNGASFNEVASALSEDPSAKQNGGELGYFSAFQMVYPFESAAYRTSPGEISDPVRTRFGYHLIKVNEKRRNEGKVRVAHIMIQKGQGDRDKAFELYDQLMAGADWDELCRTNSDDQQTASRQGELMPFGKAQMQSAPEFADVAFNLDKPGQISDPVQTAYGWHIIKLLEKLPMASFEESEKRIRSQVQRDSRSRIGHIKMIERLADDNNLIENSGNIQLIIEPENHKYVKNKWIFNIDSLGSIGLFTINNNEYFANGLYKQIDKESSQKSDKNYLYSQYRVFRENSLIEYEKSLLDEKYPEYKYLRQEYHDGILLFSIMEEEIWEKASQDTVGLNAYYKTYSDDYIDTTRIKVVIFESDSKEIIDSIQQKLPDPDAYLSFSKSEKEELLAQYNDSTQLSLQLDSGIFVMDEHPILQNLSLSEKRAIVEREDSWYYVLVVRDPYQPLPLNEIKGKVISDYQTKLENNWLDELRAKYQVSVHKNSLMNIYRKFEN